MNAVRVALVATLLLAGCNEDLSSAQRTWCAANYDAVIVAAARLHVHARTRADELLARSAAPGDMTLIAVVRMPASDWAADPDSMRACVAAFEGR